MVRRIVTLATLAIVIAFPPRSFAQAPARNSGDLIVKGRVRVIDGDTLEVYIGGRQVGIGIIGIKAPQGNTACGRTSAQYLQTLLAGATTVRLVEDPAYTFDARKRRMYYLRVAGNASAAVEMARAGLATPSSEGLEASDVAAAAVEARTSVVHKGCGPVE